LRIIRFTVIAVKVITKPTYILVVWTWILTCSPQLYGQINFGLQLPEGKQKVEIPFTHQNGFIILEVGVG